MGFYWLVLGVLCVWRITHLLNAEDGPWNLVVRLRRRAGNGFWGDLLDCFYCLSLWVAAPLAIAMGSGVKERLLLWPGLSAAAILVERLSRSHAVNDAGNDAGNDAAAPPVVYFEEEEEKQDVLRREETEPGRDGEP
jgi:hypothetical protein